MDSHCPCLLPSNPSSSCQNSYREMKLSKTDSVKKEGDKEKNKNNKIDYKKDQQQNQIF